MSEQREDWLEPYIAKTCADCDCDLDERRVFGYCRECAEARHMARQARKATRH